MYKFLVFEMATAGRIATQIRNKIIPDADILGLAAGGTHQEVPEMRGIVASGNHLHVYSVHICIYIYIYILVLTPSNIV